jgi:urease gamma subunit
MADEATPTDNSTLDANAIKQLYNDAISSISEKYVKYMKQGNAVAAKDLAEQIAGAIKKVDVAQDISEMLTLDQAALQAKIFSGLNSAVGNIKDIAFNVGIDLDTDSLNNALSGLVTGLASREGVADIGKFFTFKGIAYGVEGAKNKLNALFGEALKVDQLGLENFGNRLNPTNLEAAESSLDGLNKAYRAQLQSLVSLGYSLTEAEIAVNSFGKTTSLSISELGNLGAGVSDAGKKLEGLAGFQRVLAGTGIDAGIATKLLELQMRSLGVEANRSLEVFDTLTKVQQGTRLSIDEVGTIVTNAATKFRYFGDNIDGVATIYKQLLKGLGEGKQALAADIFDKVTSGIAGMSTEMKAFIGLTTNLGGGGGALESALQIEEAISSGEGLNEVMDSIYAKVEEISGTPLLTRQEALATGQSQQYFIQRQLLGQFTGIQDQQAVEQLVRARQGGQEVTLDQLRPGADFGARILGQSETVLNQQIGPTNRLLQQLGGTAELEGSEELSKTLLRIGQGVGPAGEELVGGLQQLSGKITQLGKSGFTFDQIMRGETPAGEKRGQLQVEKDLKRLAGTDKQLGEGKEALSELGQAQLLQKGIKPIDVMTSEPAVRAATGLGSIQQLTSLVEVTERTGTRSLEYYTNIISLEETGNKHLLNIIENTVGLTALSSADKQRENLSEKAAPDIRPAAPTAGSKLPSPEAVAAADKEAKAQQAAIPEAKQGAKPVPRVVPVDIVINKIENGKVVESTTHRVEATID